MTVDDLLFALLAIAFFIITQKLASNFDASLKFLVQETCTSFLYKILDYVSPVLQARSHFHAT